VRTLTWLPLIANSERGCHLGFEFERSDSKLRPSRGLAVLGVRLASWVKVGRRSMAPVICGTLLPAGSVFVQRIKKGERRPPSSMELLRPFISPFQR